MDFLFYPYWLTACVIDETSSAVPYRASERAFGRSEECWKQAMISKAKLC
jgi:hypothetical protein